MANSTIGGQLLRHWQLAGIDEETSSDIAHVAVLELAQPGERFVRATGCARRGIAAVFAAVFAAGRHIAGTRSIAAATSAAGNS
ncbi:MAG: hypothetical protein M3N29_06465 [Chloroflexota bacterium]|nr:hypothetical protein [Chloroflexota bacterium]